MRLGVELLARPGAQEAEDAGAKRRLHERPEPGLGVDVGPRCAALDARLAANERSSTRSFPCPCIGHSAPEGLGAEGQREQRSARLQLSLPGGRQRGVRRPVVGGLVLLDELLHPQGVPLAVAVAAHGAGAAGGLDEDVREQQVGVDADRRDVRHVDRVLLTADQLRRDVDDAGRRDPHLRRKPEVARGEPAGAKDVAAGERPALAPEEGQAAATTSAATTSVDDEGIHAGDTLPPVFRRSTAPCPTALLDPPVPNAIRSAGRPIRYYRPRGSADVRTLIDEGFQAFNAARLGEACRIFSDKMLSPDHDTTIALTVAGALTPAGLGGAIIELMERGLIDFVISTGANLYHDLHYALNFTLHRGSPFVDDRELYAQGIIRIYDVLFPAQVLLDTDTYVREFLVRSGLDGPVSTAELHYALGEDLRRLHPGCEEYSVVAAAARAGVPIYTSSPGDSSIGMNIAFHELMNGGRLMVDPNKDVNEICAIILAGQKNGAVILGGGSPKNFYLQGQPTLWEVYGIPKGGNDYFIQITTDQVVWGGLSGATPAEAVSWGKVNPGVLPDTCVAYCDSTIAFPLFAEYAVGHTNNRRALQGPGAQARRAGRDAQGRSLQATRRRRGVMNRRAAAARESGRVIRLRGGRLVLPDRILDGAALAIDDGRIVEIAVDSGASDDDVSCAGRWILPGFIDGHIHGVDGTDVLGGAEAVARVAAALPRHGVTAFCPTTDRRARRGAGALPDGRRRRRRGATRRLGARARRAPREQLPESRLQRRSAGGVPAAAAAARRARAPRRRLHRRRHRRRDRRASTVGATGHAGPRTRPRARPHRPAGRGRPPGVARALGRHLRAGRSGDRRRRAPCHASVQPHAAAGPSGARARWRGARARRGDDAR